MESMEDFARRVERVTGKKLSDLPCRKAGDGDNIGHIFCARGNTYVCGVGYPTEDEEGNEYWDDFEVVILE
jgi:hypothetical protein